jgi:glyoxylase-like metal-dependent hydrolase (beta-lactamase superfamily II)
MEKALPLDIGNFELHWLKGGDFKLDGGTMFGAVPKVLWRKRYPVDDNNCIGMCNDPLLVKTPGSLILIDSGLGNKLTDKQKGVFQVSSPWDIPGQLERLAIKREDIDLVILTHGDFDHAGGIEMINADGERELTFPAATHLIQEIEWQDVQDPGERSKATYLAENFSLLNKNGRLQLVAGDIEICSGIRLRYSGGHTRGHQIIEISSKGESAVHLGDLLPTHAHINPLWIMAYDNFPLEAIERKKAYFDEYSQKNSWFTLYHDPFFRAVRFNASREILASWPLPIQEREEID